MERTIRVSILGRPYPLRVGAEDEAFAREVAAFVENRIRTIERAAPGHPDMTHVVVAALALGEEVLLLQRRLAETDPAAEALARTASETDALADRLDAALGGPAAGDGAAPAAAPPPPPAPDRAEDGANGLPPPAPR